MPKELGMGPNPLDSRIKYIYIKKNSASHFSFCGLEHTWTNNLNYIKYLPVTHYSYKFLLSVHFVYDNLRVSFLTLYYL